MMEQVQKISHFKISPTHTRRTRPVYCFFATQGMRYVAAVVLGQHVGVGCHRILMLDFKLSSIIGDKLPRIASLAARMLSSANERIKIN